MAKVNEKVKDKVNQKISEPRKYKILMYNDEVTTMDFVVHLLMHVFNKNKNLRIIFYIPHLNSRFFYKRSRSLASK